jgi:hypothetical protein
MLRKVHLDFHTRPEVRGVGAAFDPDAFARTLAGAGVNALATPGKCQYGLTYFDTRLGRPHPGLVRPDLFPATVRACTAQGIRVQAYFTLGLDDVAADQHPDWRQRYKNGSYAQWGARHICFASPYADEVVIPEALEMIDRCPGIAGFWFDICLYCDGAFYSPGFERVAKERLKAKADDDGARWQLARGLIRDCCARIDAAIRARLPEADNYFNSLAVPGEPENIPLQAFQEVENPVLFGGPEKMTADARWLRWHGRPVIGLVSRFQGPWMDPGTLRTPDQMRFDVGRAAALGCHVSMGDHRHPDGTLDPEVYRRLAPIYADLEKADAWLEGAAPVREAVLLSGVERGSPHLHPVLPPATLHAARLLEEIGLQFDVVAEGESIPPCRLVITRGPELERPEGAALLVIAGGDEAKDRAVSAAGHLDARGASFYRGVPELGIGAFTQAASLPVESLPGGGLVLAERLDSASETPPCPGRRVLGAAIVQQGRTIRSGVRLFDEQASTGSAFPREVVRALCDRLLGRRSVRHNGGTSVAAHLHRVPQGYTLHLLHWAVERWERKINPVAEFPALGPLDVEVAAEGPVARVTLEPAGCELPFEMADGVCRFTVPGWRVWQMVGLTIRGRGGAA